MARARPGAFPSPDEQRTAQVLESLEVHQLDSSLIARSADIGIWHTEASDLNGVPWWLPPFFADLHVIYRGFPAAKLGAVLETGLDMEAGSAFYASTYADKAWEYPTGRRIAAMLILDASYAEKSYAARPDGTPDDHMPDKSVYPHQYRVGSWTVHTRFRGRPMNFTDEGMYGHWIPGNARDALLGVVLGGPRSAVLGLLDDVRCPDPYGVELILDGKPPANCQ